MLLAEIFKSLEKIVTTGATAKVIRWERGVLIMEATDTI